MTNVNGIHPSCAAQSVEPAGPVVPSAPPAQASGVSDVVEISTAAALAAKVHEIPDVRADLVARVKQEIKAGTYETPEKIEAAVERLLDDLLTELP